MENLYKKIEHIAKEQTQSKPVFFDINNHNDQKKLMDLLESGHINHVSDDYIEQMKELFAVKNPSLVYQPSFPDVFKQFISWKRNNIK